MKYKILLGIAVFASSISCVFGMDDQRKSLIPERPKCHAKLPAPKQPAPVAVEKPIPSEYATGELLGPLLGLMGSIEPTENLEKELKEVSKFNHPNPLLKRAVVALLECCNIIKQTKEHNKEISDRFVKEIAPAMKKLRSNSTLENYNSVMRLLSPLDNFYDQIVGSLAAVYARAAFADVTLSNIQPLPPAELAGPLSVLRTSIDLLGAATRNDFEYVQPSRVESHDPEGSSSSTFATSGSSSSADADSEEDESAPGLVIVGKMRQEIDNPKSAEAHDEIDEEEGEGEGDSEGDGEGEGEGEGEESEAEEADSVTPAEAQAVEGHDEIDEDAAEEAPGVPPADLVAKGFIADSQLSLLGNLNRISWKWQIEGDKIVLKGEDPSASQESTSPSEILQPMRATAYRQFGGGSNGQQLEETLGNLYKAFKTKASAEAEELEKEENYMPVPFEILEPVARGCDVVRTQIDDMFSAEMWLDSARTGYKNEAESLKPKSAVMTTSEWIAQRLGRSSAASSAKPEGSSSGSSPRNATPKKRMTLDELAALSHSRSARSSSSRTGAPATPKAASSAPTSKTASSKKSMTLDELLTSSTVKKSNKGK